MPLSDFLECMFYESMEPFGDRRLDILGACIRSTIANWSPRRDPKSKPLTPQDFMPDWDRIKQQKQQTPQDMLRIMLALQQAQQARIGDSKL